MVVQRGGRGEVFARRRVKAKIVFQEFMTRNLWGCHDFRSKSEFPSSKSNVRSVFLQVFLFSPAWARPKEKKTTLKNSPLACSCTSRYLSWLHEDDQLSFSEKSNFVTNEIYNLKFTLSHQRAAFFCRTGIFIFGKYYLNHTLKKPTWKIQAVVVKCTLSFEKSELVVRT